MAQSLTKNLAVAPPPLPLVLIGIFLERYIVMGLTAGSGK